jgi:RHS repeat-associated protein
VIVSTDARGYSTRYVYTGLNQVAAVIDPNANVRRSVFNPIGEMVQTIDGNGHSTNFGFNVVGQQNSVTDADSNVAVTIFNVTGSTLETIDPNGNPTVNTLDADDRAVKVKDPLGNVTSISLDPAGLVVSSTDGNGKVTLYQYNKDSEETGVVDPLGHQVENVYDKLGELVATYDGNHNGMFSGFNGNGQATGTGLATGSSTTKAFNGLGQTTQATDPDNNLTRYLYNLDGWQVAQIDPLGHFSYVAFNPNGQPTQKVDADGRIINATYDPAGRMTGQVWLGANGAQADSLSWQFDHADNVTTASDNYGSYTFTLDAANFVTRQVDPFNITLNFSEDHNGNVTQVTDSTGGTENSFFNGDNLLTSRRFSGGPSNSQLRIDVTYTPDLQVSQLSRYSDTAGNNLLGKTQNTWDVAGNITEIKHTNAANTVLEDFTYVLDAGNRLSSETDTINGTGTTTNYGYDTSNQLTSAGSSTYSWDSNGNTTLSGNRINPNNQLATDGVWTYTYDPAGNVIQKVGVSGGADAGVTWVYGFDNLNHLASATQYVNGTLQIQEVHIYDVFGERVEQDVTQSASTTVTKFAYNKISGNNNVWAELNSSNQVQTRLEYLNAIDAVFAQISSSGVEDWYLADHLGSVRGLMNNSGTLADAITYNAWGAISSESSPLAGDLAKYAGYQFDSATGMDYVQARWYDPATARWESGDPLGLAPDSNPSRYVHNGPTNLADPSGLFPRPPEEVIEVPPVKFPKALPDGTPVIIKGWDNVLLKWYDEQGWSWHWDEAHQHWDRQPPPGSGLQKQIYDKTGKPIDPKLRHGPTIRDPAKRGRPGKGGRGGGRKGGGGSKHIDYDAGMNRPSPPGVTKPPAGLLGKTVQILGRAVIVIGVVGIIDEIVNPGDPNQTIIIWGGMPPESAYYQWYLDKTKPAPGGT